MQTISIIVMSVVAAIVYGILHDQITARICIEYFTVGHPQILPFLTDSPTLLGVAWGFAATWWVGIGLGIPLAAAARLGSKPKKSYADLLLPMILLLFAVGVCAFLAALAGYYMASRGYVVLTGSLAQRVPPLKHTAFIADGFAHNASYLAGFVGGVVLMIQTWRSRKAEISLQMAKVSLTNVTHPMDA